jgi:hypothetical protein
VYSKGNGRDTVAGPSLLGRKVVCIRSLERCGNGNQLVVRVRRGRGAKVLLEACRDRAIAGVAASMCQLRRGHKWLEDTWW